LFLLLVSPPIQIPGGPPLQTPPPPAQAPEIVLDANALQTPPPAQAPEMIVLDANAFIEMITDAREHLSTKIDAFVPDRTNSSAQLLVGKHFNIFNKGLLKQRLYSHEEAVQMVEALARAEMNFSTLVDYVMNELREQKDVV